MIVNNLLSVDEEILMESQMEDQAPTKIVEVLEDQLGKVELNEKGIYEETTPNIAVQAQMLKATQLSEENMMYLTFISESNKNGVGAVEVFADGVKIPDAANVSIALPSSISDVISVNNMTDFRIIVIVYNDSRLFQSAQFINDTSGRRPNSQVISLSVPGLDPVKLDEPIVTTFIPIEISETNRNTTCVFWDFILDGIGGWSTEGCTFVNGSDDGSDKQYCECTHLTNFAILMDFHQMSSLPPAAADIVIIVGLSISIAFLFLTLLTFVIKRSYNSKKEEPVVQEMGDYITSVNTPTCLPTTGNNDAVAAQYMDGFSSDNTPHTYDEIPNPNTGYEVVLPTSGIEIVVAPQSTETQLVNVPPAGQSLENHRSDNTPHVYDDIPNPNTGYKVPLPTSYVNVACEHLYVKVD
ncbi:adhesion G-protein coupled receptor G2-like isoform X2 [Anneissia japonica]|uniref:adhesion G-protein coupled receptor G2-like isoform X2 n=1 Tax=Anneissia japonica TaxID=1529436 RepID=UPI00142561A4|nr:adhesion G-protein coupled receptor G2-like isoform X2 [Anneissia japonica]